MHEHHTPGEGYRKRRRKGRLSVFEMFVMGVGYLALLYLLARGLVYVAVLLGP